MNLEAECSLFRSGRRSATTRAINVRLDNTVIEVNNRWRMKEHAQGKGVQIGMIHHYSDLMGMLDATLAFPLAM